MNNKLNIKMSKITGLENVKVRVIDTEKLKEIFAINVPDNQRLVIRRECVFADCFMIKTDCQFSEIQLYHHKENIQKCLLFECSFDTKTSENGWGIGTTRFGKFMTFNDFLHYSKLIPITEFIRYNYNPRIIGNQNLLLEYINDLSVA